ncbi:MAG TPA: hypothetical protein VK123_01165 [Candidatus Limnocylindrales bacterium]|nr:hypothetical protein [Candidatus Limnocylindrales bacterium]
MRNGRAMLRRVRWLLLLLATLGGAGGCANRVDERAGATVEREEVRAGNRVLLRSSVSPRRSTLGDPVVWTLSAELPASARPGKLLRGPTVPELDVRPPREGEPERRDSRTLWSWPYQIRGFGLGRIALPAVRLPVEFGGTRDTLLFPADTLAVDSLTAAATGAVLPDRGPITPELRPIDYAVAGLLALLLLALIALAIRAVRRRRHPESRPAAPPEPPEAALRRVVADLRDRGERLARGEFYDRISLAVRDYAAAVTGITTRDRTTMEVVRDLEAKGGVPRDGIDALRRALARADLAKFARRGGGWEDALDVLELAHRLPERLPQRQEPPAHTRGGAGAGGPPADARASGG